MTKFEALSKIASKLIDTINSDPGSIDKESIEFAKKELSHVIQTIAMLNEKED
jgi:hypothetical protein